MTQEDRELINQFKAEYRIRISAEKRLKYLEAKKEMLMDQFSVHSPNLDGVRVNPTPRSERLANYATATKTIEDEELYLRKQIARVDVILCEIPAFLRKHMYNIYSGKYNYAEAAFREGISERQMKTVIDNAILEAFKKRGLA